MKNLIFIFALLLLSCSNNKRKKNVVAKVNDSEILLRDIDKLNTNKIHDLLFHLYHIRRSTLDEVIGDRLLKHEATKANVGIEELLDSIFEAKNTQTNLNEFILTNELDKTGIPYINHGIKYISLKTDKGKQLLKSAFKDYILNNYKETLKLSADISIFLEKPFAPKVNTDNLDIHYTGNSKSKTSFLIISDPNCLSCRESNKDIQKILNKYKNEIEIGYSYYSDNISLQGIVAQAASRQGKFWDCHQLIMENPISNDTTYYYNLLAETGLDLNMLKKDIIDSNLKKEIKSNFKKISQKSIYGTPTFIINNKIITKEINIEDLDHLIKKAISKS